MIPLIIQDLFYTVQNLQRSPIPQTSNWSGTFFAVSYCKLALEASDRTIVYNDKMFLVKLLPEKKKSKREVVSKGIIVIQLYDRLLLGIQMAYAYLHTNI